MSTKNRQRKWPFSPTHRWITLQNIHKQAYEEVVSQHLDALYRAALRFCGGHRDDAEDLLQESLLQGLRHWHELREPERARAWLFRILSRTHLNRRRSRDRRREVVFDEEDGELERLLAHWHSGTDPERLLRQDIGLEQILSALDKMPDGWRETFWLSAVEGFAYREVAAMLEIPVGSVASRVYRARRRLQESLLADARWLKWR